MKLLKTIMWSGLFAACVGFATPSFAGDPPKTEPQKCDPAGKACKDGKDCKPENCKPEKKAEEKK